ncbi:pentapeptide repeat-containing protein [Calothrix sp. 336/3]|uniref:pentapeptide repeat-containing protein n=1 Tax=Calothrix sp. 336/3 TaxID=1337936 RepID=UPI0004E29A3A|nr:pentapeptide repeat-containing protein [Calothrix sp. 336/3]AKG22299.1 pentapeptide repeat-containing protein [Calothrix sp. 336/3]
MKQTILAIAHLSSLSLVTILTWYRPAIAANPEHLRQLLATKQCENCDLSGAGLVISNLAGANLRGANLTGANLSRANLSAADLTGADLSGASLFGANLTGAKLPGAIVMGTDLRNSYLGNADLTGVNLSTANLQGAVGIPLQLANYEQFYAWGVTAAERGIHQQAIDYFNQAIAIKPDYAGAYLARGVTRYQILDRQGAIKDAQIAEKLFTSQNNQNGLVTAQAFLKELQTPYTEKLDTGKPSFLNFVGSLGSLLLQFLPF